MNISKERADWLLDQAGELVDEDEEQLKVEKYKHLLSDKINIIIQEVLSENNIVFKLQDFQLLTLDCLGNLKKCINLSNWLISNKLVLLLGEEF